MRRLHNRLVAVLVASMLMPVLPQVTRMLNTQRPRVGTISTI